MFWTLDTACNAHIRKGIDHDLRIKLTATIVIVLEFLFVLVPVGHQRVCILAARHETRNWRFYRLRIIFVRLGWLGQIVCRLVVDDGDGLDESLGCFFVHFVETTHRVPPLVSLVRTLS